MAAKSTTKTAKKSPAKSAAKPAAKRAAPAAAYARHPAPPKSAVKLLGMEETVKAKEPYRHVYHHGAICETDARGHATPGGRSTLEIVVDASEGFIPLWAPNTTLRWRFREASMQAFVNPEAAKGYIRSLLGEAILLWGQSIPVKFSEVTDAWDFEMDFTPNANCSTAGCTLARAFFPDGGQHDILLYPTMFQQSWDEQVETLAHEIGHVFGLRHFFAQVSETAWPSEIFGTHDRFSIMNYGADSKMSDNDRNDLRSLYYAVWSGQMTELNGTPIKQVEPFSLNRLSTPVAAAAAVAVG